MSGGQRHHRLPATPNRAWRVRRAITVVTKSGTNEIHGSAFEFHNDQHLNSRAFFQAAGTDKPLAIYNNFGGTVGGPIKKNKLFYFLSYDGTRQRQSAPGFYTVPTSAFKNGDFSAVSTVIYDPNTGNADGTGRTPFAGNVIPTNRIRFHRAENPELLPVSELCGAESVREQLLCRPAARF